MKKIKKIFYVKLIDNMTMRKTKQKKIEPLDMTQRVNHSRL